MAFKLALNEYHANRGNSKFPIWSQNDLLDSIDDNMSISVNGGPFIKMSQELPSVFYRAAAAYIRERGTGKAFEMGELEAGRWHANVDYSINWRTFEGSTVYGMLCLRDLRPRYDYEHHKGGAQVTRWRYNAVFLGDGTAFDLLFAEAYYNKVANEATYFGGSALHRHQRHY